MKFSFLKSDKFHIEMKIEDLLLINAALNEVCNGVDVFEFETRIGASREEAGSLMDAISSIIDGYEKNQL